MKATIKNLDNKDVGGRGGAPTDQFKKVVSEILTGFPSKVIEEVADLAMCCNKFPAVPSICKG
jgi:hypothetical protein